MVKLFALILVNVLTAVRVIGVFLLLPIYRWHGGVAAAILAIFCYFTDSLDGIIARKCHVSTFFGSAFDGFADKLFTAANLLVLLTITKIAIIPLLCEAAIVVVQAIKFSNSINVQSSKMGKIKTWVISLTVIVLYLITDIEHVKFFPVGFKNFISSLNMNYLLWILFIPLFIFEALTLFSYLKFLKTYDPNEKKEIPKIDIYLKKPKSFKDKLANVKTVWFTPEFFDKYKDSTGLNEILNQLKYK